MITQGTTISARNLQAVAWIAFGLAAPQIFFLRDWDWLSSSNYDDNPASAVLAGIGQGMNGVVVLFAFLATSKLFFKNGQIYSLIAAGSWSLGLSLFLLSDYLLMKQQRGYSMAAAWYHPLESTKFMTGLLPTSPAWWQWANLGGTISAILYFFIAIKIGKPEDGDSATVGQDPSGWIRDTNVQPLYLDQIQQNPHKNVFCSQCGTKTLSASSTFCGNCGAPI